MKKYYLLKVTFDKSIQINEDQAVNLMTALEVGNMPDFVRIQDEMISAKHIIGIFRDTERENSESTSLFFKVRDVEKEIKYFSGTQEEMKKLEMKLGEYSMKYEELTGRVLK